MFCEICPLESFVESNKYVDRENPGLIRCEIKAVFIVRVDTKASLVQTTDKAEAFATEKRHVTKLSDDLLESWSH